MRKRPSILNDYINFVDTVTSDMTKNYDDFKDALDIMQEQAIEPSRLLTASVGLSGEVGEFNEIIKKIMFQEKTFDDLAHEHMKKELGDVMWYVVQACLALKVDLVDVINTNKDKFCLLYTSPSPRD